MAETTREELAKDAADLAAAARDRGIERIEDAKDQAAEGAERIADAVEHTADELAGDGDDTLSGFGRSAASLMRQLAGGLRERDVEGFARELGAMARRNPGMFLAGSVALGFGMARFFKARGQRLPAPSDDSWSHDGGWRDTNEVEGRRHEDLDAGEAPLDPSGTDTGRMSGASWESTQPAGNGPAAAAAAEAAAEKVAPGEGDGATRGGRS
jgi:hypothetical protein